MEEYVISNYKEVSITSIVDLKIGDLIYHKKSKKLDHVIVSLTNQFLLENEKCEHCDEEYSINLRVTIEVAK